MVHTGGRFRVTAKSNSCINEVKKTDVSLSRLFRAQGGLQPPSSLLNPVDLPPPSPTSPGVNNNPPTSARWNPPPGPPPNHYLSAPNTTMPNGTGSGRRTPSPTRSRPTSATGTRPVKISEKQYEPHFGLSNLSYTPINYPDPNTALDKQYPTPEHLFQAMKVLGLHFAGPALVLTYALHPVVPYNVVHGS